MSQAELDEIRVQFDQVSEELVWNTLANESQP